MTLEQLQRQHIGGTVGTILEAAGHLTRNFDGDAQRADSILKHVDELVQIIKHQDPEVKPIEIPHWSGSAQDFVSTWENTRATVNIFLEAQRAAETLRANAITALEAIAPTLTQPK